MFLNRRLGSGVRFAPSPSGPFHIGNLRTAWISWAIAKALGEPWVVRVEDIDTPRVVADAWSLQRHDLAVLGLTPARIVVQSDQHARHLHLFQNARASGQVYPCDCSRREVLDSLAQMTRAPHERMPDYSGRCRERHEAAGNTLSLRNFKPVETLAWRWRSMDATGHSDAIIARTDAEGENFVPGYHWACAIDDADGEYHVLVRAWDLASINPLQREIRRWVKSDLEPVVFHTALVVRADGGRLEKRTQGVTLSELQSAGLSAAQIIDKFESSFDLDAAIEVVTGSSEPQLFHGEPLQSLSAITLGATFAP